MADIVKGRAIAKDILNTLQTEIRQLSKPPVLDIFIVSIDTAIESFVARKRKSAEKIGVTFNEHRFPETVSQEELEQAVRSVVATTDGIVVQLPLPQHLSTTSALAAIPPELDVDVLTEDGYAGYVASTHDLEPPVGGAVREIIERHRIPLANKNVVVIGKGHLVGMPVIEYLNRQENVQLFVADKETPQEELLTQLKAADVIISGTGVSGLVQPEMIKEGVALLDAGTSGSAKQVLGDIAHECAEKASVFSRTPGGIGPITVAILYRNLLKTLS